MALYLVKVISSLLAAAVLVGIVFAYARNSRGKTGAIIVAAGIGVGVLASAAIATVRLVANVLSVADVNYAIASAALVACAVALLCAIANIVLSAKMRGSSGKKRKRSNDAAAESEKSHEGSGKVRAAFHLVLIGALAVFAALYIAATLPDVIRYPFEFNVSQDNLISSDMAYRVVGYIGGLAVVALVALSITKACKAFEGNRLSGAVYGATTAIVVACVASFHLVTVLQIMIRRKVFAVGSDLYTAVFNFSAFLSQNAAAITILVAVIAIVLAAIVIYLSLRDREPYSNPAEHRKIKARWRNRRRWAICLIICMAVSLFSITWLNDFINRGPEISPVEEAEVHDGNVYVSFEQLEDGHLHRFAYTSDAGVELANGKQTKGGNDVRFIIIKKPGSSSYGVGLDACEICGQTGYYERDNQVVCKLCDVVMNINTIGFKGGCNPIPIEYSVENGYIVIPCDALSKHESIFKS